MRIILDTTSNGIKMTVKQTAQETISGQAYQQEFVYELANLSVNPHIVNLDRVKEFLLDILEYTEYLHHENKEYLSIEIKDKELN